MLLFVYRLLLSLVIVAVVVFVAEATEEEPPPITYVDIGNVFGKHPQPSLPRIFAIQVCAGLYNRNQNSVNGAVYTFTTTRDVEWLVSTNNNDTTINIDDDDNDLSFLTDPIDFLQSCLFQSKNQSSQSTTTTTKTTTNDVVGYMRYSFEEQKIIIPNLVTLAAVLNAVPLEDDDIHIFNISTSSNNTTNNNVPLKFDAITIFPSSVTNDVQNAPRTVTEWVLDHYGNVTTRLGGLAKMNPGLDVRGYNKIYPPLTGNPNLGLVDYIVKERLFNFFLYLGCVPLTDDHQLMERIATSSLFRRKAHRRNEPLAVMGYDDTITAAGGDIFEAETDCVKEHNMGQIASDGCSNLSFYSGRPSSQSSQSKQKQQKDHGQIIHTPLTQVPDPPSMHEPYNANVTYLTVIMGDGDNLNFLKDSRRQWMEERLQYCGIEKTGKTRMTTTTTSTDRTETTTTTNIPNGTTTCFPLVWSMSPATLQVFPDLLRWYYEQSHRTMNDWFVLPPSGHMYAYPGEMQNDDQASFVAATEHDAWLMNTSATVSWEFTATWENAIRRYFPRYVHQNQQIIKACFAVNVPYFVPIYRIFGRGQHYVIINDDLVIFAPREWRGKGGAPYIPFVPSNGLSPHDMATEINNYPRGTVSHIYATSDGGFDFSQLVEMVDALDDHVRLVNANELALRAKQRNEYYDMKEKKKHRQRSKIRAPDNAEIALDGAAVVA